MEKRVSKMNENDLKDLQRAKEYLEYKNIVIEASNLLDLPFDFAKELIPKKIRKKTGGKVEKITKDVMMTLLQVAFRTIDDEPFAKSDEITHKYLATLSGAVAGFFGLPALALDLTVSTGIILRSIGDIARSEGESLSSIETRLACLEVFALGGGKNESFEQHQYYVTRAVLAQATKEAAEFIAEKGLIKEGAPHLVRYIIAIAERFSVNVSEKLAAQSIPLIGAIGGGAINLMFTEYFQNLARGHFIIRRLERKYGAKTVKEAFHNYNKISDCSVR